MFANVVQPRPLVPAAAGITSLMCTRRQYGLMCRNEFGSSLM